MTDIIEPGTISRTISAFRDESAELPAGVDFSKMVRFFCDQILAAGYSDLN